MTDSPARTVYDLAKKYFPRLWGTDRIQALLSAGRLSREEAEEIMGEPIPQDPEEAEK